MSSYNTLGRMTDMLFEELERERSRVEGHPWACDRARYARGADRAEDE